jgi:hypothetical protein
MIYFGNPIGLAAEEIGLQKVAEELNTEANS